MIRKALYLCLIFHLFIINYLQADAIASPSSAKKSKEDENVDVEAAARSNLVSQKDEIKIEVSMVSYFFFFVFQLSKLTIPMLKDYCRDKKLRASGTKKQDYIDAIQYHLGISQ